ncbi:MAG: ubiquinol-cytochrome c reductase iron-sulfur subunit [Cycloclasticus pugetii]|jgi:ubiquinol-cytochrome c reductase iron-sulfur subunit|uniref:Ubiquinol-cytochrome c reductase iron-sulfur subunit n=2 Tax=Cycloclasticus TaxID=34067 RepID=S5TVL9_9GAMM|nr:MULTISPECIES: ubiquinol-cytochrome c reductase iron-sulfur subunit [Cycloclasticus]AFT67665.1 Ubiquinol-cytochrome c reductase iron-sulfur subunit [Cycloclasticus sp. P1]AGS39165.1 Ubiquinol-cytochrome c reductase iron-sulfur subunit [Cycloclasticus zancles 78-ME]ATI02791.1 ubiquinol-cytochrome c reductase iron-sulfur subunit [Cycloclasticus sp. PY97N]EPD13535.1 ubiquinol-cytochrome c reductase iron-sulfur subunit [Cycloclasticus pugetii]MBV1898977.1 ubiquinol-cytochrome c reductase iron-su|tara:strand:- start:3406 stop:3999 length:594 start_codon:yes stop_codon:yes gene_type:complete
MSEQVVDKRRRLFLTAAATAVTGVGAAYVAVPFIASMNPSDRAKAAGAPVEADIGKLEPGQLIRVEWRGKPVWVLKRSQEALAEMAEMTDILRDPDSNESEQPESCKNVSRSIKPEVFIAVGICTHLGCSPTYRPEVAPEDLGPQWKGGFFCPCHGSLFDLSGRVYAGVPAPLNLVVPPHEYITDTRILIGSSGGQA